MNRHEWDATGERCVKCGAKDWMGGECSSSALPACSIADTDHQNGAQDALNRMKRASERGTGCHLTAEMVHSLSLSFIGEIWHEPDPRQ